MTSLVRTIPLNMPLLRALSCQMLTQRAGVEHPSVQVLWRYQQLVALRGDVWPTN